MSDHRIGLDLFNDVLDVLDRHGFACGDDEHAGRAIFLIGDLARIYEGAQDHPFGPSINPAPSAQMAPEPPGPDSHDAVTVPVSELKTVLLALNTAADDLRDQVRAVHSLPGPVLPRLPVPPPRRPGLPPARRPHPPARRSRPGPSPRPGRARPGSRTIIPTRKALP